MFYGLAWYINEHGGRVHVIIRDLRSLKRHDAEKEARRIAHRNGHAFEGIHLAKNHRQKQGEPIPNRKPSKERAAALQGWRW